jgi:hypothetical protein
MTTTTDPYAVAERMLAHGSGFERRLADLWAHADQENRAKVEATWREVFEKWGMFNEGEI